MSTAGSAASTVDSNKEELQKVDPASGSRISKESVQFESKENLKVKPELGLKKDFSADKKKDMPELKKKEKRMVGLPPINVNELTTILQDPTILSEDLMKEIAEKIKNCNEEIESKAASKNKANPLGIRSVLDCIMEVTLSHTEAMSDEEEEDQHELHVFEIPCDYCKKIFGSTMSLKTHVLMSHSQDDPSVLNVRLRSSIDDDKLCELSNKEGVEAKNTTKSDKLSNIGKGTSHSQPLSPVECNPKGDHDNQCPAQELSDPDKMPASKSPTAVDSTSTNVSVTLPRSSLRNRKRSLDTQDVTTNNPDLKQAAIETVESQSSPDSLPQSSSQSVTSGKRKSENLSPSPSAAKKGKRSRRSTSGEDDAAEGKESAQPRRSSRRN